MISGISLAFWIGFLMWYFYMTERGHGTSGGATQLIFKRGAMISGTTSSSRDEEKGSFAPSINDEVAREKADDTQTALPSSRGVFSWHHMNYDIPLSGGQTRRLLDDVSGYVMPGKLVKYLSWFNVAVLMFGSVFRLHLWVKVERGRRRCSTLWPIVSEQGSSQAIDLWMAAHFPLTSQVRRGTASKWTYISKPLLFGKPCDSVRCFASLLRCPDGKNTISGFSSIFLDVMV